MDNIYRVTPKKRKNGKVYIVQRITDRKQIGKPFELKSNANAEVLKLSGMAAFNENKSAADGLKFIEAFKTFADAKVNESQADKGIRHTSARRYETTFRLRIVKYLKGPNRINKDLMDEDVLLSEFGNTHMKSFLQKASDDGVPYKSLINAVKDIQYFLREANADGLNPNMSMITFKAFSYAYIQPKEHDLKYKKDTVLLTDEKIVEILTALRSSFGMNTDATNTFAIFCMLFLFGLRPAELSGLKKASVDFEKLQLHVKGTWITAEGGFQKKTKNKGSYRSIDIEPNGAAFKFLTQWLEYLEENHKYSIWLFPGIKGDGPLSYKYINSNVWKTYAKHGLADITVRKDGHVKINSSPLKGQPIKMFRHRKASQLIDAMVKYKNLSQNQVKAIVGHTKFATTAEIYGNKVLAMNKKTRSELANSNELATNAGLISSIITKN